MSSPAVYVSDNEDDSQGIPVPRGDEVFTQVGDKFGPHFRSQSTHASLGALRRLCNIPQEIEFSLPGPNESPEMVREGYCCAYEVYFKGCGLFFPIPEVLLLYLLHLGIAFPQMAPNFLRYVLSTLTVSAEAGFSLTTSELLGLFRARDSATAGIFSMNPIFDRNLIDGMPLNDGPWRKYWFFFRINPHSVQGLSGLLLPNWSPKLGNQTVPRPIVDFLSFFRIVSEGETNWNSFTLQRIHKAGLAIKDGKTHPLDPPPEEKDVSSLNVRDKRKIQAETKALKDQLSEIGKKKRIAAISRVGSFHKKTLLVDDGSLEAALSSAVDSHGADIPNDPPVATAICSSAQEREREETPSLCTKRKAPDSDTLSNERLKTVRLSSPPRAPSFLHSVFPSFDPSDSELPLSGDRVIPEEIDEPRPKTSLSQGLSVRTQSPLTASISDGEEIGDIFRGFQTREGTSLPPFSVWRPEIRQMFVSRACYLSQAFMETNGMIFHYENLLHQAMREVAKAKKEVDELRLANQSERSEQARALESSFENMKKTLAGNEQCIRIADAERDSARSDALRLESELEETTALLEEMNQKTELLIRNRARDIAEAEHNAREEMRGFGRQLIQSIMKFIKDEEVWTKLQSDRAELKSNLDLIGGIESGRISLEDERREVSAELAIVESELSSASRPSLDLGPFSLVFRDSPSQFEVGEGSRPYEDQGLKHDDFSGPFDLSSDEGLSSESCSGSSTSLESLSGEDNVIDDDLPGAPDIELTKTGRTGEPEGSRILRKGTSIQVPIVLIERLSAQDRFKAEEFINKLITRHDELEDEKKKIRKKRRELGKRCLDIDRELHCLEAHPSDWIELGLQEYGNMLGCIMSIIDLAGQGAELFRNSRPF
ncbi:hypothetical protein ISN44_As09g007940 [Arabidopsis suecica]|uniref:Uncharacterized protein n=1 Tax=Arabidopsis suecica TaxID=45249 RepID=A0A8T2AFW3_ARASU|nr:hypothetical protein ISN44_As09g007940 [Arabidopsis suecica]